MSAAAANFPDCWLAYGATNDELRAYGPAARLAPGRLGVLLLAQLALAGLCLLTVILSASAPLRVVAALAALVLLASAGPTGLRFLATPRALRFAPDALILQRALGPRRRVSWDSIGEIGLAQHGARLGVGLRLRAPDAHRRLGAGSWGRRLNGGFDHLLWPADGDQDLLGRVLLRYCIDPRARRRYLSPVGGSRGGSPA